MEAVNTLSIVNLMLAVADPSKFALENEILNNNLYYCPYKN